MVKQDYRFAIWLLLTEAPDYVLKLVDEDLRWVDQFFGIVEHGIPITNLFGIKMSGFEGFLFLCRFC